MDSLPVPSGGDHNRGPELVAVTWAFTTLASIIVSLKIFTRVKILQELALDDLFTVFALVSERRTLQLSKGSDNVLFSY